MKVPGVDALRDALAALRVDTRGHKSTLRRRLRAAEKRQHAEEEELAQNGADAKGKGRAVQPSRPEGQDFDSYLVLDFEATCQRWEPKRGEFFGFPNEIIEFPVVLLRWRRMATVKDQTVSAPPLSSTDSLHASSSDASSTEIHLHITKHDSGRAVSDNDDNDALANDAWELVPTAEFRRFVRPTWRPKLTEFCKELTGIAQVSLHNLLVSNVLNAETCAGGHRSGTNVCTSSGRALYVFHARQWLVRGRSQMVMGDRWALGSSRFCRKAVLHLWH